MFDVENILAESPPFSVTLEISLHQTELDIVPHWYSGETFCSFYIFQNGRQLGTIISTNVNEWEWLTEAELQWLAQLIGNEIDWHYV